MLFAISVIFFLVACFVISVVVRMVLLACLLDKHDVMLIVVLIDVIFPLAC